MDPNDTYGESDYYDYPLANCLDANDFRDCEFPSFGENSMPAWEIAVKAFFHAVVIILALVGNVMVIMVVANNQRMRTTTNFYLVNLAVCDLFVTLSCTWVNFVEDVTGPNWELGGFLCQVFAFAQVLSLVASVLTLSLIAGDRFFGVVFALKARITDRKAIPFLLAVWVVSVGVSIPLLVFRRYSKTPWKNHVEKDCEDDWPSTDARKYYYTVISLVLVVFPICFMAVTYFSVIWTLRISHIPGEQIQSEVATQKKVKRKVIMMLIVILALFTACWVPWIACVLFAEYEHNSHQGELSAYYGKILYAARFMSFANSAFNPIVYAGFNQNFKRGFKDLFTMKSPRNGTSMTLRRGSSHSNSYHSNSNTVISKV